MAKVNGDMFSHDEILIVGDSFAYERLDPRSWIRILTKLLTGYDETPRGKGFPGCSWWSVRKCLLSELSARVPRLLIVCHTEEMRIPSDEDFPLNFISVEDLSPHLICEPQLLNMDYQEVAAAGRQYYKYLYSDQFHLWAQSQWFKELDDLVKKLEIPYVIHIHCFPRKTCQEGHAVFKNGMIVEEILCDYAVEYSPDVLNHFTVDQNKHLAHQIYHAVNNYSIGFRKLGL